MRVALAMVVGLACATSTSAGDNYAFIVSGASGGDAYAQKYEKWRTSFVETLRDTFGYPDDHIVVLAEKESGTAAKATRENVQRLLGDLRKRLGKDDQLLVLLIGHGTSVDGPGGEDAKFNLVGPDLRASEWDELLKPIAAKLVFVDTTGASFAFLKRLAGRGRIVLTATDSAAQQFETVFPDFFLKAFADPGADKPTLSMILSFERADEFCKSNRTAPPFSCKGPPDNVSVPVELAAVLTPPLIVPAV